jgi:beta-galactosidase
MEAWHREYPNLSWISSETKASREDAPADWADVDFSNNSWFSVKSHVAGQFIWAGIDYLGETRGWPDKGCRAGMLSTAGFVKPYAYYNQSLYTDRPMVHVAVLDDSLVREMKALKTWQISWYGAPVSDHWTFPEKQGKKVSVFAFTNCETVDLTLNGRSLGEKSLRDFADRAIQWQVTYEPGLIAAIGRNGDREVCRHVLETAGEAVRIDLKADRVVLAADGRDVAHVEVRVSDKKGVTVPAARHRIRFRVDGPASLLAADNGDLADHTPYAKPVREARNGRCLALILAGSNRGIVRVHAEADGLESRPLVLQVE